MNRTQIRFNARIDTGALADFLKEDGWSQRRVFAFLDHFHNPALAAAAFEDGKLAGLVQPQRPVFILQDKKCFCDEIIMEAGSGETKRALEEAVQARSACTSLLSMRFEPRKNEKLEQEGWIPALKIYTYEITSGLIKISNTSGVYRFYQDYELYPVYKKFRDAFQCGVQLDECGFYRMQEAARQAGYKIFCALDSNGRLDGFCFVESSGNDVFIPFIIYENGSALQRLLVSQLFTHSKIRVALCENERIEKVFPSAARIHTGYQYVKIHHEELLKRFLAEDRLDEANLFSLMYAHYPIL